jgi:hypothetical protein
MVLYEFVLPIWPFVRIQPVLFIFCRMMTISCTKVFLSNKRLHLKGLPLTYAAVGIIQSKMSSFWINSHHKVASGEI